MTSRGMQTIGLAAAAFIATAVLLAPSVRSTKAGKVRKIELTASFYDPLVANPAGILRAAIDGGAKPADARYDAASGLLVLSAEAADDAAAKAAAESALTSLVAAYKAHPARQEAAAAYLAAREFGVLRLVSRPSKAEAAAGIPVAATILRAEAKSSQTGTIGVVIAAGLASLAGLLAAFVARAAEPRVPKTSAAAAAVPVLTPPPPEGTSSRSERR